MKDEVVAVRLQDGVYSDPARFTAGNVPEGWVSLAGLAGDEVRKIPKLSRLDLQNGAEAERYLLEQADVVREGRRAPLDPSFRVAINDVVGEHMARHLREFHAQPDTNGAPQAKPGAKPKPRT